MSIQDFWERLRELLKPYKFEDTDPFASHIRALCESYDLSPQEIVVKAINELPIKEDRIGSDKIINENHKYVAFLVKSYIRNGYSPDQIWADLQDQLLEWEIHKIKERYSNVLFNTPEEPANMSKRDFIGWMGTWKRLMKETAPLEAKRREIRQKCPPPPLSQEQQKWLDDMREYIEGDHE